MKRFRMTARRVQAYVLILLRTGPWPLSHLYHWLVADGMRRERHAITAGHRAFLKDQRGDGSVYAVRRYIHMLEKGLTMKPRRASFAPDYIEQTVLGLRQILGGGENMPLGESELLWMRSVLSQYFEATSGSSEGRIARARRDFNQIPWPVERDDKHGPRQPKRSQGVAIDGLLDLAQQRSSVRWFTQEAVPRSAIEGALAVAAESPTACNRQPFFYRIFDAPQLARRIASVPLGTTGYAENVHSIAVLVGDLSAFGDERDRHLIYVDGCLSAMSFIFGLEAQGIASCCINWPDLRDRDREMAKLLGLRPFERVIMLIAFGYAAPQSLAPASAKKRTESLRSYNEIKVGHAE